MEIEKFRELIIDTCDWAVANDIQIASVGTIYKDRCCPISAYGIRHKEELNLILCIDRYINIKENKHGYRYVCSKLVDKYRTLSLQNLEWFVFGFDSYPKFYRSDKVDFSEEWANLGQEIAKKYKKA